MGLEAGGRGGTEEEKKKEEKIPHMCESIGHRPLRGRCPKKKKREKEEQQGKEQDRIHGYRSRVWVGRGSDKKAVMHKPPINAEKANQGGPTDRTT